MKEVVNNMFSAKLPNGLTVVGERMPGYRSVSMGVWINAGSVYERGGELGAAHFIEHMLFKGTKKRSASRIAEEMDAVGGNLNAFTSKECTCVYVKVIDEAKVCSVGDGYVEYERNGAVAQNCRARNS